MNRTENNIDMIISKLDNVSTRHHSRGFFNCCNSAEEHASKEWEETGPAHHDGQLWGKNRKKKMNEGLSYAPGA